MMTIKEYTIGTDPEFIIVDRITQSPISVIGKLGGSKKRPKDISLGCAVQEDNVLAELTIPPCNGDDHKRFYALIDYGRQAIERMILAKSGIRVNAVSLSSAYYPTQELDHVFARQFGCEKSFCIYTGDVSPRPSANEIGNLRSAGFHLHLGVKELLSVEQVETLIFLFDIFLGVPSLLIDPDENRRKLYGNAGDHRVRFNKKQKSTIIEYRSLGAYLHSSQELIKWCVDQMRTVIENFNKYQSIENIITAKSWSNADYIKDIIDNNDINEAKRLSEQLKIKIPECTLQPMEL